MKHQYLIIASLIILIVACGNSTEEAIVEEKEVDKPFIKSSDSDTEKTVVEEEVFISENEEVNKLKENKEPVKKVLASNQPNTTIKVAEEKEVEEKSVKVEVIRPKHEGWNGLTKKYVSAAGKVNYKGMKADINKITTYLEHLKKTPPKNDWTKSEKLAYWLNLYNASTVYLIVSNYPVTSITKLNGGKPWDKKFVKSGNKTYSLNEVENSIVRPRFKEPRIHAALNCAAVSCPKLLNEAFLPGKLNAQLDKQTRAWINDVSKNKLDGKKVQVSQIFDWYKADFKDGVIAFINKYATTKVSEKANISYLEYDWALNE